MIEAGIGMGNAHEFRLGAVNRVTKNPAAALAMRIHATTAIIAFAAGRNAGDQRTRSPGLNMVQQSNSVDLMTPIPLMPQKSGPGAAWNNRLLRMLQVGAADCGFDDLDDGIVGGLQNGFGTLLQRLGAGSAGKSSAFITGSRQDYAAEHDRSASARLEADRRLANSAAKWLKGTA